ncbi:MAG: helix-turn-helix transcriptional regulator [Crocinitomicaceae bacterium]|nr:helix-turn-helix transcriptional regulator [Crocinitomicaceae bacterium]
MIPLHESDNVNRDKIQFHQLGQLSVYDFSKFHRHNYFELFFFRCGGGTHIIDFQEFEIKSNMVHIVAPGQIHQVKRDTDSRGFVMLFNAKSIGDLPKLVQFFYNHACYGIDQHSFSYSLPEKEGILIDSILQNCWELEEGEENRNEFIRNALRAIGLRLMKLSPPNVNSSLSEYGKFRTLLIENFREMKKVMEYADALGVSSKRLNSIVKTATGETASQLIYRQLILESRRLLRLGYPIKEVAYQLKFDDPAHFSKFFKTQTGKKPSEIPDVQD